MDKLEKVIKGLKCCESEEYNCAQCSYAEVGLLNCFHILRRDALELLKEKQLRWISVTDRLPQDDGYVLVWVNGTYHDMAYRDEGMWYDEEHNHLKNITHWMPLPEPPKEGE